ncbi:hypothetical protein [Reyranella sp.]|uniref:hypothetical protein n=1 Tax=Reyranella sp. TaxID=1929291 RepID=UPI0027300346|nr:hypothetical protein [Reyranella sp.]MDP2376624.1 hypothetical protein [Reyranella sp.]
MADGEIPRNIRKFIARHLDSVGQLEALLLLRSAPGEAWEATRVAGRLYVDEREATEMLERLCHDGLLVCTEGTYRYSCRTEELQRTVDEVAHLYARQLIPITNMIHAKSRRIRQFSDAFRFRKGS